MKKTLLKLAGIAALAFAISSTASAAPINGAITFSGGAVLDNNNLNLASSVTSWIDPVVSSRDGDFIGTVGVGDAVNLNAPWAFNSPGGVNNFWSVGGFTFDLTSSVATLQTSTNLIVEGKGFISGNGYSSTAGIWRLSTQSPSAKEDINGKETQVFSFSAASEAKPVPDGGTTAALLGAALVGMSLLARRRAA